MSLQVFNVSVATIMFSVVDFVSISVAFLVERLDMEQNIEIINTKTFALLAYGENMKRMHFLLLSV